MPKITSAYFKLRGLVSADAYAGVGIPLCPDDRCRVRIAHASAHVRVINGNAHPVRAYFRQMPNYPHADGCRFNTAPTVARLVRVAATWDGSTSLLVDGALPMVRLDIMAESYARELSDPPAAANEWERFNERDPERLTCIRTLRTAKAILALIARTNCDRELQRSLSITFGTKAIPWRQFFYDETDLHRLIRNLQRSLIKHPVAIVVNHYQTFPDQRAALQAMVRCEYTVLQARNPVVRSSPDLYTTEKLAERLERNGWSLVCGVPRLKARKESGGIHYDNVSIDLRSTNQFCLYTPLKP